MTLMLKVAEAEGYAAAISTVSIAEVRRTGRDDRAGGHADHSPAHALRAETIGLGIGWATGDVTGVRARVLSTERFMALVPATHPLPGTSS
ncbi:hypothetical protein WBG99_18170 [Streptomyces sp. TG1A-60]|uniref:hypothetical protein n=1 Tax=Streptomyces sp. TG1A-60 TaxID=3129111 RepID=UPI0030CBA279